MFVFEIFYFKRNCTSCFHVIQLMIEKEFLDFLTRFYSRLWLLSGYAYPNLKKYRWLNLELVKVQTRQVPDRILWGDKLISEYFENIFSNVFIDLCNVKNALSGLRQFLETKSSSKMMKDAFYFTLNSSSRSQDIQSFVLNFR